MKKHIMDAPGLYASNGSVFVAPNLRIAENGRRGDNISSLADDIFGGRGPYGALARPPYK